MKDAANCRGRNRFEPTESMTADIFRYGALFCFSAASFGFIFFKWRYPRRSRVRVSGIRLCHGLGFLGVLMQMGWIGGVNGISIVVLASLTVSLVGFEISEKFLD
jgi:hypothetical protein